MPNAYHWENSTLYVTIFLQPRASKNTIVGWHDGKLKVQITAPPVDGKANKCLCEFLAKYFGVAKSAVTITKGETGRTKLVRVDDPQRGLDLFRI